MTTPNAARVAKVAAAKIGRPRKAEAEKSDKRPRSVRLGDEDWAELQRRGTPALEAWLRRGRKAP